MCSAVSKGPKEQELSSWTPSRQDEWQQKRKEKHSNYISDGACKVKNREFSFYSDESSAAIHIFHDFHG